MSQTLSQDIINMMTGPYCYCYAYGPALLLTFDNITNASNLVTNYTSLLAWNTFFDFPTNGNPFTRLMIQGNTVKLIGGSNIHLRDYLFQVGKTGGNLVSIIDTANCITSTGSGSLWLCSLLTTVSLPAATSIADLTFFNDTALVSVNVPVTTFIGNECFNGNSLLKTVYAPLCITLGTTTDSNNIFTNIYSNPTITVSNVLQTCDSGNPDGDLINLLTFNPLSIINYI